jgi:hypothetical protein
MVNEKKRKWIIKVTKFQFPIIVVSIVPTLTFCVLLTILILYMFGLYVDLIEYQSSPESLAAIHRWCGFLILSVWSFFVFVFIWAQMVSHRLVGAFERLLRELDEAIATNNFKTLKVRDEDYLAHELIKRINVLLDKKQ